MRSPALTLLPLSLVVLGAFSPNATAQSPEPGSLLVYPMFDNRSGQFTIFSVTNSSEDFAPLPGENNPPSITANFVFVEEDCQKSYASETLTPNDNFTGFVRALNGSPNSRGYFFVYASGISADEPTEDPIVFNELIGTTVHIDGIRRETYELQPISYQGIGEPRESTDRNNNGIFDLDGNEYRTSPDELLFPFFLGQSTVGISSDLVLINMTAFSGSETAVDFLIYNDNEEVFSAEITLADCWNRVPLRDISALFRNSFLRNNTNNAPDEFFGFPFIEAGWIRASGTLFLEQADVIVNPAIHGTLLRRGGNWTVHPFAEGENETGRLFR